MCGCRRLDDRLGEIHLLKDDGSINGAQGISSSSRNKEVRTPRGACKALTLPEITMEVDVTTCL